MPHEARHSSAAHAPDSVAIPIDATAAAHALRNGPIGALAVSSIAVAVLLIGWLVFYFCLFLPRGPVG